MTKNWVVYWLGKNISENLNRSGLMSSVVSTPRWVKNRIIHWHAINYFIQNNQLFDLKKLRKNFHIITFYHLLENDAKLKIVPFLNKYINLIITPSPKTKKVLINAGFEEERIKLIPMGVDLSIFKRYSDQKRLQLKKKFNLPLDKVIIGSFQKDGIGWGDGMEPKLEKGPDIFCKVIQKLSDKFDIHVFLTGPARGYVKRNLEKNNIPYTHVILDNYLNIIECYNTLDLYLIAARIEGGPLALPEGMATGVPIVSTKVGMAPYFIKHGFNGYITEIEDIEQIYRYSSELIENEDLRKKFIANGLETVKKYSWDYIVKKYYIDLYKKYLIQNILKQNKVKR